MNKGISRRNLLKGIGFGLGAAALAACAPSAAPTATAPAAEQPTSAAAPATDQPTSTAAPATEQPTTAPAAAAGSQEIVYWGFSGDLGKTEDKLVAMWHESQSDVKVDRQVQGSYEETAQKLTAALAANNAPDMVLLSDVWWFKFYRAKVLKVLDDLAAAAKIDSTDFVQSLWNEGVRKDHQYWIPFARSTPLFYYNADMLAAAGLPDRGPKTWDEFMEWAPKLVKKEGDTLKVAAFAGLAAASYSAWVFQCVNWAFGGSYSTPELKMTLLDDATIEATQFYSDMVNKQKVASTPKDVQKDFINGLTATAMLSTGGLTGILRDAQFKVGTAFIPEEKQFGCCTGGSGLAILTSTSDEKSTAAAKYIAYATGNEGGAFWSQNSGYMPVRTSTAESDSYKKFFAEHPQAKTAVDQLPKTRGQDSARVFIPGGDQILGKGLDRIVVGKEDVKTVWTDVTSQLDKEAEPVRKDLAALGE
jgi:sn-glycerol 3-phosphate transport system substrate-binding protein